MQDQNRFQYKSTEAFIAEGFYKSSLVTCLGEFAFDDWNILRDFPFSDNKKHFIFQETEGHYTALISYIRERRTHRLPERELVHTAAAGGCISPRAALRVSFRHQPLCRTCR
jgi:hypothetical protein